MLPTSVLSIPPHSSKAKMVQINPFKTTTPSQIKSDKKQSFQDHHSLSKQKLPQISPYKASIAILRALSPLRPEQCMCRSGFSPVLLMNGLFKTPLWAKLSYWLDELCFPGDINKECTEAYPVSVVWKLCLLGDLNNEHAKQSLPQCHQWNDIFRIIFKMKLSYHLNELSLLGDLTTNVQSGIFPSVIDEWLFWDHLLYQMKALSP